MRTLKTGQRVLVKSAQRGGHQAEDPITINALGTVERVRHDGGAWVTLATRSTENVHPFPADDETRGSYVLTYPEHCELPKTTAKEIRAAERAKAQPSAVTVEMFGRDHWSTFAYLETRMVDDGGRPERQHMRCDPAIHPLHAHLTGACSPTRLKDGSLLHDHDDWSCVDDLIAAGFIVNNGSAINPVFSMTARGDIAATLLRRHKKAGGNFSDFNLVEEEKAVG